MFERFSQERLVWALDKIQAELANGVQDDLVRAQYERAAGVITNHLQSIGGVSVEPITEPEEAITETDETTSELPDSTVNDDDTTNETVNTDTDQAELCEPTTPTTLLQQAHDLLPIGPLKISDRDDSDVVAEDAEPTGVDQQIAVITDVHQLSPIVESGNYVWTNYTTRPTRERIISPEELDILRAKQALREARRENQPKIVRFDPEFGAYDVNGHMYSDATDSPAVAKNMQAIVEMCDFIADHSKKSEGFVKLPFEHILQELHLEELDAAARRVLFREVSRLLSPCGAVRFKNNIDDGAAVFIYDDFSFFMTELLPKEYKFTGGKQVDADTDLVQTEKLKDRSYSIETLRSMLLAKTVPLPSTQKHALELLDAMMCNAENFIEEFIKVAGRDHVQIARDIVHVYAQQELGWAGYISARRMRTFRSGNLGFVSVVRQVTGTQQAERFQKSSQAPTDRK